MVRFVHRPAPEEDSHPRKRKAEEREDLAEDDASSISSVGAVADGAFDGSVADEDRFVPPEEEKGGDENRER